MTKTVKLNNKKLFMVPVGTEITEKIVSEAIALHKEKLQCNYIDNENMYMSNYKEINDIKKAEYKPNNKLVMNYAKYIVDTFSGYHMGIPVAITHQSEEVSEFVKFFRKNNDMEDTEFELSKIMDIYGHGFLYVYQDENGETRTTYNTPTNMFIVHDNSVSERPLFAVRYVFDSETQKGNGEVLTDRQIIQFEMSSSFHVKFDKEEIEEHPYSKIPVIEAIENEERQGIFDSVKTLINALNKALSEKANDVDYFADAYLKIIGMQLDENVAGNIRDSRILNLWNNGTVAEGNMDASFLDKPNADTTQENLIALLKEHISKISMVADLSDKDFGNASGTALAYKLQAMDNLAKTKDRKMQSAFNRLYEVVFSVPKTSIGVGEWRKLEYTFKRNVPRNILEEAQIINQINGQVSDETKLSILSIVSDPRAELEKIENESKRESALARRIAINERRTDNDLFGGADVDVEDEQSTI